MELQVASLVSVAESCVFVLLEQAGQMFSLVACHEPQSFPSAR